ncbi:hypothetical protein PC118_g20539 [Phytophthora cactorum]|uniref:Uncharacterized protein n=1 Tax=Phytophthora cactorum TaxID=29920 RepID=A0A8T1F2Q4_9STRA|nr:hypothetical protein PC118_g20539 [Phytophthora cactorum]
MKMVGSVSKRIQSSDVAMWEVRALFDALLQQFPVFGKYLDPSATIGGDPSFESAVVKLQRGRPLGRQEKAAIEHTEALGAEYLGGVKPDASVGPGYHLIEAIKPRKFDLDEFHSLKVEVGISKPGAK